MTRVYLERDGPRCVVRCIEHADGWPEVCAAISTLMYSAAGWLQNREGAEISACELEPGDALLDYSAGEAGTAVYELLLIGFLQLEARYPQALRVMEG